MNYGMIARFLEVATVSPSYPEFMMEIVFRAKADVGTREFYCSYIVPLIYSDSIDDSPEYAYVAHYKIKRAFREKLYALPWFIDYLKAMNPYLNLQENVATFHC